MTFSCQENPVQRKAFPGTKKVGKSALGDFQEALPGGPGNVSPATCFCPERSEEMWLLGFETFFFFIQLFDGNHQWCPGEYLTIGLQKKSGFNLWHLPISVV